MRRAGARLLPTPEVPVGVVKGFAAASIVYGQDLQSISVWRVGGQQILYATIEGDQFPSVPYRQIEEQGIH